MASERAVPTVHVPDQPDAGPSSQPLSRSNSPHGSRTLRRPASHGRLAELMVPGRSRSSSGASQSETPVTAYADDGAVSSGRSTPEQRRKSGKAAAASLLASDAKYKKFAAQVDKCLQSFESVNEWADFISFLSRLLKTLQTWSTYTEIPRKLVVSKRLAQCLNPALPSGVHQRALDVYAHIFASIGVDGLRRDMLIWSSGFFPFFQFASTSVRPQIINIFQTYYLSLGRDLRQVTKAIILALLPGMEEETGDFFDKILSLFGRLSDAVSTPFFLSNIFLVLISSPASRLSALNYLAKILQKPPDPGWEIEPGLIIRGVAAALGDDNVLVRRNGLDLLVRVLKIHEPVFREATEGDRKMLMRVATGVVLQREISLSRRVYTWLLGPDETSDKQVAYFQQNSLDLLVSALEADFMSSMTDEDLNGIQHPFKVFLSLMDRWEIGANISPRLAIPALRAIKQVLEVHQDHRGELLMTGTAVYEAIEPVIIWRALYTLTEASLCGQQADSLTVWILKTIPQKDEEVTRVHMPLLLEAICSWTSHDRLSVGREIAAMDLVTQLVRLIPQKLWQQAQSEPRPSPDSAASDIHGAKDINADEVSDRVMNDVAPRIVQTIFALTTKWSRSKPEVLVEILKTQSTLLNAGAATLRHISAQEWLEILSDIMRNVPSFPVIEASATALLQASSSHNTFEPLITLGDARTFSTVLDSLRPDSAPTHTRCIELIRSFTELAETHILENVIANRMSSPDLVTIRLAFQSFGILWKRTEDSMLPGKLFDVPLFRILDALDQLGPLRWDAEIWLRNRLGSPFRLLDPLLDRLLDPSHRTADIGLQRTKGLDCSSAIYLLSKTKTLLEFEGQGLGRACSTRDFASSPYAAMVDHAHTQFPEAVTYLDLLVSLILRFLDHQQSANPKKQTGHLLDQLQSVVLDLLQLLISQGQLSPTNCGHIARAAFNRLSRAVDTSDTVLQPRLLDVLQGALNLSSRRNAPKHHRGGSNNEKSSISSLSQIDPTSSAPSDAALVDIVARAIGSPRIFPILRQWIDFTLYLTSRLHARPKLLHTLSRSFSEQLSKVMLDLGKALAESENTSITEEEPSLLLIPLERLVSLSMSLTANRRSEDGRSNNEGGGLLGLMSGVFVADGAVSEKMTLRHDDDSSFEDAIRSLLVIWTVTSAETLIDPANDSQTRCFTHIRKETRSILERFFKSYSLTLMESMATIWATAPSSIDDAAIFDSVDMLAPSATRVVKLLSDSIAISQKQADQPQIPQALLAFLEAYISRLEAPIALQVWGTMFNFARETMQSNTAPSSRPLLYPVLRCLTRLSRTVATTSAFEDRRLRRDLQEVYGKLLETVVISASRLGDTPAWRRINHKSEAEAVPMSSEIQVFLAENVLPHLRSFLHDPDKVAAACANISSNIVSPAFRQKQRVPEQTLRVLREMTRIPSATKAWRLPIGEAFNDGRFFKQDTGDAEAWAPLVCALMDNDKDRFAELLARITAAPSANIFANREQETITRSMNLRRLSFVLFAAEINHYLTDLPAIQEALVDILRTSVVSPKVHSEVYLCLRILMCRFSAQHLTNFWPVILAELLRVFEGIMDEVPPDRSEPLHLALAACKFLDLLLVIQSEDFQVHQWMFVTDTTDAVYPPSDYTPEAIMDRLAEIVSEESHSQNGLPPLSINMDGQSLRRPRLTIVKNIDSLSQLTPFFSRATIDTYEGAYLHGDVDWEAVEEGLSSEIFDGRQE